MQEDYNFLFFLFFRGVCAFSILKALQLELGRLLATAKLPIRYCQAHEIPGVIPGQHTWAYFASALHDMRSGQSGGESLVLHRVTENVNCSMNLLPVLSKLT